MADKKGRWQRDPMDAILQTRQEAQQEPQQLQPVEQPPEPFDAEKERAALGIEPTEKRGRGKPRKSDLIRGGAQDGLTEEWTRASFIMRVETLEKLKDYAYTNRIRYKDALNQILTEFLDKQDDLLPHQ